jgi:hypothetical protein
MKVLSGLLGPIGMLSSAALFPGPYFAARETMSQTAGAQAPHHGSHEGNPFYMEEFRS